MSPRRRWRPPPSYVPRNSRPSGRAQGELPHGWRRSRLRSGRWASPAAALPRGPSRRSQRTGHLPAEWNPVPCAHEALRCLEPLAMLKVVIADDHRLILDGIKRALEDDGGFEVVGEANTGERVLPLVSQTNPDPVLLDLPPPGMYRLLPLSQFRKRRPSLTL